MTKYAKMKKMKKNHILIADDVEMNRDILQDMMEDIGYATFLAENGQQVLDIIHEKGKEVSAMLLDLTMPIMNGIEVMKKLKEENLLQFFPILIITAEQDAKTETDCFDLGAFDFIRKPFDNHTVERRVKNAIQLYELKNSLQDKVDEQTEQIRKQNENLIHINENIIELLGNVVEFRNNESGTHIKRVKTYSYIIGEYLKDHFPKYKLNEDDVYGISITSPLHDLGKIKIPDAILLKPGKLDEEERKEMNMHTIYGTYILESVDGIWEKNYHDFAYQICACHHERYDGNGYPNKLKGEEIPISAQIVAMADVFDALVTERSYKKAFTPQKAFEMIENGECGKFSDDMLACLEGCKEKMENIALGNLEETR